MNLENKAALVTGGARDIGRAVCVRLAQAGAKVAVNYRGNQSNADDTLAAIEAAGGEGVLIKADVTDEADVKRLIDEAAGAFGGSLDVLVNNVGGLVARKALAEMDMAFFEHVMRLNVTSTFLMAQHAVPKMGDGGSIVNFASQAGRDGGGPGAAAYASSKGAVMTLTRALAKELGPSNIRVNCVCPGMISTSFHDEFTKDAVRSNVAAATPLKREGRAEEVADLVAYLASDASSFITGASYDINGGLMFS